MTASYGFTAANQVARAANAMTLDEGEALAKDVARVLTKARGGDD